jgi:hypothetical protein
VLECECGVPGCWPLQVRIELTDHDVVSRDFRQPHRLDRSEADSDQRKWSYDRLGPFQFSRHQYEVQIRQEPTTTLYRPVGPDELNRIEEADWRAFPPRLPAQPISYPVLTRDYARQIARDWNARDECPGFVVRFEVRTQHLLSYSVEIAAGRAYQEYWIAADELPAFNDNIVGRIEVVDEYRGSGDR